MVSGRPLLAYFGHHRCASTWCDQVFRAMARELRLRYASFHNPAGFEHDLRAYVERHRLDCVAFTNADWRYVEGLDPVRAFHVIRDPRDVAVSCYFSHRYSHAVDERWPELADRRRLLSAAPEDEGLLHEIHALADQYASMAAWHYDRPDVLELTMEQIAADPYQQMLRVAGFLGLLDPRRFTLARRTLAVLGKGLRTVERLAGERLTIPIGPRRIAAERLLGIVWEHEFEKLAGGRRRGQEDPRSHYRKGTPGDWRTRFGPAHVAAFRTRYPGLLSRLGYEPDDTWAR